MDRLTEELTMVSINTTELEIQIQQLRRLIDEIDPQKMTATQFDALLAAEPGLAADAEIAPQTPPPLYDELTRQLNALRVEAFALTIEEIQVVQAAE